MAPAREPRVLALNRLQGEVCFYPARFKVIVCGRRWGKTWTGRTWLTQLADQRCRLWYVAPTYRIAHDIIWREMLETIPSDWYARKPNQTRLELELKTGALIQLKGADDPDSLRGRGIKRLVIDEYATMPDVWDEILRPALADTLGQAMFLGTPKGFDHFHRLYKRGLDPAFPDWQSWRFPTCTAPHISSDELAAIRREAEAHGQMHVYRQEYEAAFEARAGMIVGPVWEPTHTVTSADVALVARGYLPGQRVVWHVLDDPHWVPSPEAKIYGSVDYGFTDQWSVHLHAVQADSHVRTFAELYGSRVLDHDQARRIRQLILRLETDHGVQRPAWLVCDPMMFSPRPDAHAKAIIAPYLEELASLGVRLVKGTASRQARLSRPNRWLDALSVAPDGLPYWSCTSACPHLIRTVPEVPWDEDDPNVEDDSAETHCIAEGTLVTTSRGDVPIERVSVDDEVLTREGWRSVVRAWCAGRSRDVWDVTTSDGRTLRATPDHEVWVEGRGWTRVDALSIGYILCDVELWSSTNRLSSLETPSKSGAVSVTTETVTTSADPASGDCIDECGLTSSDRFRWACTSITRTATKAITRRRIWSYCQPLNIWRCTVAWLLSCSGWLDAGMWRLRTALASLVSLSRLSWCPAGSADGTSRQWLGGISGSGVAIAAGGVSRTESGGHQWNARLFARAARQHSQPSVAASGSVATTRVTTVRPSGRAAVYDLTIAGCHEFFANGILVSNCYEETGRFFEERPVKPRLKPADPLSHLDPVSQAEWRQLEQADATRLAMGRRSFAHTFQPP